MHAPRFLLLLAAVAACRDVAEPPHQFTQHLLADRQLLPHGCRGAHAGPRNERAVRDDHTDSQGQVRKGGCQLLYVTNSTVEAVTVYTLDAIGNVLQTDAITGSSTGLNNPDAVAVDAAGNIYVANFGTATPATASITIYAPGASGDATPTATIAGSNTGLSTPQGIAVDAAGIIYVANDFIGGPASRITVYAPGASGNATPDRSISGGLDRPRGIAVDAVGNIYVTNEEADNVTVYAAGANGLTTPIARIEGLNAGLFAPGGIVLDAAGSIYVTSIGSGPPVPASVRVFAPGANFDATPTVVIAGANTGLFVPFAMGLDAAGKIYVANGNNTVTVYAAGATGDATPLATIPATSATGGFHGYGLAVHSVRDRSDDQDSGEVDLTP
jgi:sugar lactone lactonase YvrE